MTNRSSQYKSLLLSLIGKRGNIKRSDLASIHHIIQAGLSPAKVKKQTAIERSRHKYSRERFVKRNFPMFGFSMYSYFMLIECLIFTLFLEKIYQLFPETSQRQLDMGGIFEYNIFF